MLDPRRAVLVTFTRLRLPDGTEARFEGAALDILDGKPGLVATRRVSGDRAASGSSVASDIAKGAASTVLSAATGGAGLPGQLVKRRGAKRHRSAASGTKRG